VILRMKFALEREVSSLTVLNDTAKNESARLIEEIAQYKANVARYKERAESKLKVQASNLLKAEEEVEALDSCLKQLRILLLRHESLFARGSPDLQALHQKILAAMGSQECRPEPRAFSESR